MNEHPIITDDVDPAGNRRGGKSRRYFRSFGIRARLCVVLIAITSIVFVVSGILDVMRMKDRGIRKLEQAAGLTSVRIAKALALPVWELEVDKIKDIVHSEMDDTAVFAVLVKGKDGKSLIYGEKEGTQGKLSSSDCEVKGDFIISKHDILKGKSNQTQGDTIGVLELYLTKEPLIKELHDKVLEIALKDLLMLVIIVAILYLSISRLIMNPILKIIAKLRESEGDLTRQMEIKINSNDEIGELADAINSMVSNLGETIRHVSTVSDVLSSGAAEQAESMREVSASLDEMASSAKQNAQNAVQTDTLMREAKQMVNMVNSSILELISSMEEITAASKETQNIIRTIDEIAFQTNLLALNAAVEAARAGEAGAGFAVVADEVRRLATRAAEAARNTADLIEKTVKKVNDGAEIASRTGETFAAVESITRKVGEFMAAITNSSDETARGIEWINTSITEISDITRQNEANAQDLVSMVGSLKVARTRVGRRRSSTQLPAPRQIPAP